MRKFERKFESGNEYRNKGRNFENLDAKLQWFAKVIFSFLLTAGSSTFTAPCLRLSCIYGTVLKNSNNFKKSFRVAKPHKVSFSKESFAKHHPHQKFELSRC